jgi:galacturonokinase
MEFPDLQQEKARITEMFAREQAVPADSVRVIASPYRICPLGAHVDHQGGPVLGMTINACTLMAFVPSPNGEVCLRSRNYPGKVRFNLERIPETVGAFWGVYARAAALALSEFGPLRRGITGLLDGMLPGCGLSSSASVLLGYLHALAAVNDLQPAPWDYVHLTRRAENAHIGLNNGILDQTSIVFGRRGHLLHIDTRDETVDALPDTIGESNFRILVAYSGYSRELTTTGYNSRVQECRDAAARLAEMAGGEPAQRLADVPEAAFFRHGHRLAPDLAKRARHFFTETARVRQGIDAWRGGDLDRFGRLMAESCQSSIEQYECGSSAIHDLQQIVASAAGMIGSRFSGGGFGGCVVGLVRPAAAAVAVADIHETYRKLHPEVAEQSRVYLAHPADGVRLL